MRKQEQQDVNETKYFGSKLQEHKKSVTEWLNS